MLKRFSIRQALTPTGTVLAALTCVLWMATGQAQVALPPSVVLVLKVISSTHARPTTGIVVTDEGLVVVPAAFVERGDEIVVLEDGTDLTRNARTTRPVARSSGIGLAVLATEGLNRPGTVLSLDTPVDGERLSFVAFPPADELASGAEPIREHVRQAVQLDKVAISTETPLPNLNGALLDGCGYLAGLVLATGEPSLARDVQPGVILRPRLGEALAELEVTPIRRACRSTSTGAAHSLQDSSGEAETANGPQMLDPDDLQPAGPDLSLTEPTANEHSPNRDSPKPVENEATPETKPGTPATDPASVSRSAVGNQPRAEAASPSRPPAGTRTWVWTLFFGAAAGLAGWWFGRRGGKAVTVEAGPDSATNSTLSQAVAPSATTRPAPATERVRVNLEIVYPDGHSEHQQRELEVDGAGVLLGRGQADIVLPDLSVSRMHGRLRFSGGGLTYADLGSEGNSWVDDIACLEGEVFCLEANSLLQLGHVRIQLYPDRPDGKAR